MKMSIKNWDKQTNYAKKKTISYSKSMYFDRHFKGISIKFGLKLAEIFFLK